MRLFYIAVIIVFSFLGYIFYYSYKYDLEFAQQCASKNGVAIKARSGSYCVSKSFVIK